MLDIKMIRENPEAVMNALKRRNADVSALQALLDLDVGRRALITETEALKHKRKQASVEIGKMKKQGLAADAQQQAVRETGDQIAELDAQVAQLDEKLSDILLRIPNMPHSSTPDGLDAAANLEIKKWGEPVEFGFTPKTHVELGEKLGIFDFARAAKITGAGFPLYVGAGARLERALIQFMLDVHVRDHGFTEVSTPFVCNSAAMTGTGQLPKMADDMYHIPANDLWLIPTAEVPITNIYMNEIIEAPLPVYLCAYSPCFRKEAGAAGKETRGLIRVHQFDKVEMVKFVKPETSYEELEKLVQNAEDILQRLELPYRILSLCAGDISFAAAKCYDIELWAPGQNAWLEVSSCSNFESFQARRAGIRYRNESKKPDYVHTLNGSGVALARLVVAILENGQQADGSIVLPKAIVPYMGGQERIG